MPRSTSYHQTGRLFRRPSGQDHLFEKSYEEELEARRGHRVECLGLKFENDDARRAYFLRKLKAGLDELHAKLGGVSYTSVYDTIARMTAIEHWPIGGERELKNLAERMRHAESSKDLLQRWKDEVGFPQGEISDILNLSDPPYYTACPNPFLLEFAKQYARPYDPSEPYHRKPFASDVTEGKGGKIYKAHTYHTKVPHEAIARYILNYTNPGDLVLDPFAGCGITGVAAAFCGAPDEAFKSTIDKSGKDVAFGARRAILADLSPFATFLAHNMTNPRNADEFVDAPHALIDDVKNEVPSDVYGCPLASYVLWSQVFLCPEYTTELTFGEVAITEDGAISSKFSCPTCGSSITKSKCQNKHVTYFDDLLGSLVT